MLDLKAMVIFGLGTDFGSEMAGVDLLGGTSTGAAPPWPCSTLLKLRHRASRWPQCFSAKSDAWNGGLQPRTLVSKVLARDLEATQILIFAMLPLAFGWWTRDKQAQWFMNYVRARPSHL